MNHPEPLTDVRDGRIRLTTRFGDFEADPKDVVAFRTACPASSSATGSSSSRR